MQSKPQKAPQPQLTCSSKIPTTTRLTKSTITAAKNIPTWSATNQSPTSNRNHESKVAVAFDVGVCLCGTGPSGPVMRCEAPLSPIRHDDAVATWKSGPSRAATVRSNLIRALAPAFLRDCAPCGTIATAHDSLPLKRPRPSFAFLHRRQRPDSRLHSRLLHARSRSRKEIQIHPLARRRAPPAPHLHARTPHRRIEAQQRTRRIHSRRMEKARTRRRRDPPLRRLRHESKVHLSGNDGAHALPSASPRNSHPRRR